MKSANKESQPFTIQDVLEVGEDLTIMRANPGFILECAERVANLANDPRYQALHKQAVVSARTQDLEGYGAAATKISRLINEEKIVLDSSEAHAAYQLLLQHPR